MFILRIQNVFCIVMVDGDGSMQGEILALDAEVLGPIFEISLGDNHRLQLPLSYTDLAQG